MSTALANFGQFFDGTNLWYGVQKKGEMFFVSSQKEELPYENLSSRVHLQFPSLPKIIKSLPTIIESSWSADSIKNYLDPNKKDHDPKGVFLCVKTLLQNFPFSLQENYLNFLTLYILHTGCYSAFQNTPCLGLSGNVYLVQLLLDVLERICFRAVRLNSPSRPLASKIISLYGSTLLIHAPCDHRSHGYTHAFSDFLAEGSRFSGTYQSLNEYNLPTALPIYSPKILSMEITDQYLKSLTIEIPVQRAPGPPAHLDLRNWGEEFQKIRDSVSVFCLRNIIGIYGADKNLGSIPGLAFQDRQSWSGIFSMASYLDTFFEKPFLLESMVATAKAIASERNRDKIFDDRDCHIIFLVSEFLGRFKPELDGFHPMEKISEYVKKAGDFSRNMRPEDVGRVLNRCFTPKPERERKRVGKPVRWRTFIKLDEEDVKTFLKDD